MSDTLLVTVSGPDQPGVTAALFAALAPMELPVLDVEQVVIRGRLVLGVLLATDDTDDTDLEAAATVLHCIADDLGLECTVEPGANEDDPRRRGRVIVTVLATTMPPLALSGVADQIAALGGNIDRTIRVASYPVTALELEVSGADYDKLRVELAGTAASVGVDLSVQRPGLSRRGARLVVLDVDSTLIRDEVIELIARHAGCRDAVRDATDRAMAGVVDFAQSLRERVALLEGVPASVLDDVRNEIRLTPGARTLCRTLTRLGYRIALVSGGFHEVIDPIATELGVTHVRANRLEVLNDKLTGRLTGELVDRAGKARALVDIAHELGIPLDRTVAVGDGANDLDMLATAGLGIAFNAKQAVREAADTAVTGPYLDSVLYLLGIPREEVEAADAGN